MPIIRRLRSSTRRTTRSVSAPSSPIDSPLSSDGDSFEFITPSKTDPAKSSNQVSWPALPPMKAPRTSSAVSQHDMRRKRHNEGEIRRRKRLNAQFDGLANLVESSSNTKPAILKDVEDHIIELRKQLRKAQGVEASSPAEASVEPKSSFEQHSQSHIVQVGHVISFQDIYSGSSVPRFLTDMNGTIVACNDHFANMLGYRREEILCNSPTHSVFLLNESRPALATVLQSIFAGTRRSGSVRLRYTTSTGETKEVSATVWMSQIGKETYIDHMIHGDQEDNIASVKVENPVGHEASATSQYEYTTFGKKESRDDLHIAGFLSNRNRPKKLSMISSMSADFNNMSVRMTSENEQVALALSPVANITSCTSLEEELMINYH